jgi:two-component system, NtrC family, sensor histidine kinase HydH
MNRRLLIQVATPAVVLGGILFATCLLTAWYINRLESNLAKILSQNVTSLKAAQELEIRVRQLRVHTCLYLIEPTPARLEPIEDDHKGFEAALSEAQESADTVEEMALVHSIHDGYERYHHELAELRAEVARKGPRIDFGKIFDAHPILQVTDQCHELFRLNKEEMDRTALESRRVSQQANFIVLVLGLGAPISGLLIGYSVASRLHRSIYRLSVRVQDMARHLDEKVASVSVVVNGDIEHLDEQLQHVVGRVEETARKLQRQQNEMLRAEQLAAVGQLAASVAHEVRNPLTSVKILVEAALREHNPKPLVPKDLTVIHKELARVENTVHGFLRFARWPRPDRGPCDLRTVISQAVELVGARARQQKVQMAVCSRDTTENGADEPVILHADQGQLSTVLVNLLLNALDAMPRGGRLEIDLEPFCTGGVRLTVRDTGGGIPAEIAERLFMPFASTKATGTGLGLSISRRIVEEHGGRLTARNSPEGGACFTIVLPDAASDAASNAVAAAANNGE